jgi:dimethylargininase
LELVRLPADPDYPDSTFVEDTAVLTKHAAILAPPGAPSRLGEVTEIADAVQKFYKGARRIEPPGTVDGGDICEAGSHYFIGLSQRTNEEGARQLARLLAAEGFTSSTIDIRTNGSILHLKSGIAYLDRKTLVVMEDFAKREEFSGYNLIIVPASESYACNCVMVNGRVLVPAGFPQIQSMLVERGYEPLQLDMSEFRKMDGGLSCLSLRF